MLNHVNLRTASCKQLNAPSTPAPRAGCAIFCPTTSAGGSYVIDVVRRVYERYGFEPLETPALENIETLTGKYGEEGNKLIYKVLRRGEGEASGETDLALRYDLTVPLARVVAEHRGKLPRFFKRYQIQPVWRADRPARGRFREFYQCDVDAIGSTSPVVEAEMCAAVSDVLQALGFTDFVIQLNHRAAAGGDARRFRRRRRAARDALVALDKLGQDRPRRRASTRWWRAASIEAAAERLLTWSQTASTARPRCRDRRTSSRSSTRPAGRRSGTWPRSSACAADTSAAARICRFDPTLARGLSYYTGAIMEIAVADGRQPRRRRPL